ncbi:RecB family exonuclease [Chloroflexota bacterium]
MIDKTMPTAYNFNRIRPLFIPRHFKREETIKPLSFTQISLYQTCPLHYKLRYLDGLKQKDRWYFSFGSTLHHCVERFFKVGVPPAPALEELLQYYEDSWLHAGYESAEEEAKYKEYGKEILTRFWEIHGSDFYLPLAVEKMFYIDISGVKLRGYIDRADKLPSGGIGIIDYKSNKEFFTNDYLRQDLQLTLYQMAAEQMWQLPVEQLTLYHLRSNTPCSCPPREPAQLEEARHLILDVAENITAQRFPATKNAYCPCDFPEHCPYYRHLYSPPQQELLPGLAIAEAVDDFARLQDEIKDLQIKSDELRQMIIGFCENEALNTVYGGEHSADYRVVEKQEFETASTRQLLEPLGLWERVLKPDQSLLKELITDEEVARDVRKKLSELRRIISSYPQLRVKKLLEEEEKD